MAYKIGNHCLPSIVALSFLLYYQVSFGQYDFKPADEWLEKNLNALGRRAVMMVYKDGKNIYSHSLNDLSRKQEFVGKGIASRTGKSSEKVLRKNSDQSRMTMEMPPWLNLPML
jgi:hypothetical protein